MACPKTRNNLGEKKKETEEGVGVSRLTEWLQITWTASLQSLQLY